MNNKYKKQLERVLFLNEMVQDLLVRKLNYLSDWRKWKEVVDEKGHWSAGDSPEEPTRTEINRLMLVLRKESIKLDKLREW